jgi:hypothetical protein
MTALLAQGFPLGKIVCSLSFDIRLSISAVRAVKFLHNRILHADFLDGFVQGRLSIKPRFEERSEPTLERQKKGPGSLPFLRRENLDYTRPHAVLVNFIDERLEVAELCHRLPDAPLARDLQGGYSVSSQDLPA